MSVSARQKVGVLTAAAVATGLLAFAVLSEGGGSDDTTAPLPTGTVTAQPSAAVDVVDLSSPAQAAIAVSSRLFKSTDVAVLTTGTAADRTRAVAAAERLRVPVLVDDPASVAELTRLRARQVLTFGDTADVVGAVPAATDPAALQRQIAGLPVGEPAAADALVMMKSAATFDVAAATATIAGATVVETDQGDPRSDPATAKVLAAEEKTPVIALGAPFTDDLAYTVGAVRTGATQIGGGYLAARGRTFVGLHGRRGDPDSGMLGEQDTAGSLAIIEDAAGRFAANDDKAVVPFFEIVATAASAQPGADKNFSDEVPLADLEPVVDAAEKAGLVVLIDLQPGSASFLQQAQAYESLLARKNVGLTLEPRYRVAAGENPVPGNGSATAAEIDEVSTWLADLTAEDSLPQKLLVVRDDRAGAAPDLAEIDTTRPELSVVVDVDVTGTPATKLDAWQAARSDAPAGAAFGWIQDAKNDRPMFTVNGTYRLISPYPTMLTYR